VRAQHRLVPLNAFVALLRDNELWPPTLRELGFRLVGLEIPTSTDAGKTVLDAVALHEETNLLVVAECKSGANIYDDQARKLDTLDPTALVQTGSVTLASEAPPTIEVVYVCLEESVDRIQHGLNGAGIEAPLILAVDQDRIRTHGPSIEGTTLPEQLPDEIRVDGPPPRIVRFDTESTVDEFVPAVLAELVAAQSHRRDIISIPAVAEGVVPELALYGKGVQRRLASRVEDAAQRIAEQQPENFRFRPRTQAHREAAVEVLRSPEDRDPRGRTQAYQAIARRAPRPRKPKPPPEDQLQLDLVAEELNRLADVDDEDFRNEEDES
jgi:hypothetical protein